jgi:hypothetical protein
MLSFQHSVFLKNESYKDLARQAIGVQLALAPQVMLKLLGKFCMCNIALVSAKKSGHVLIVSIVQLCSERFLVGWLQIKQGILWHSLTLVAHCQEGL